MNFLEQQAMNLGSIVIGGLIILGIAAIIVKTHRYFEIRGVKKRIAERNAANGR